MDWALNHLQLIIAIGGTVAWWLNQRKHAKQGKQGVGEPRKEATLYDPELAERTRRIREEIRRKIEERREQSGPPPVPDPARPRLSIGDRSPEATPPPTYFELPSPARPMFAPAAESEAPPLVDDMADAVAELACQKALEEQLRQVVARKEGIERQAAFEDSIADKEQAARVTGRAALLDDLHNPAALRRAFILREILGPPVALRS